MRRSTVTSACLITLGLAATPARAAFHFMKVVEFFPGTSASPDAQYVVLQMYFAGQNFVATHRVTVFDATGTNVGTFTFAGDVANGANQAKILIATPAAQTLFGITADLAMTLVIPLRGGKICFDAIPEDCVAWGTWSGGPSGVGTPVAAPAGLRRNQAVVRRLDVAGSPTILESADDTDVCASDFRLGVPAPVNNAGHTGVVPDSICGNDVIEGLEECDDGNLVNDDTCDNTCSLTFVFGDDFEAGPPPE